MIAEVQRVACTVTLALSGLSFFAGVGLTATYYHFVRDRRLRGPSSR